MVETAIWSVAGARNISNENNGNYIQDLEEVCGGHGRRYFDMWTGRHRPMKSHNASIEKLFKVG